MSNVKEVLLLGSGHANIQVLHHLATLDRSTFHLTLISESWLSPYSGMIPSYLAGVYEFNELQFDLSQICHRLGHDFVKATVSSINGTEKRVVTSDGKKWPYDICSINLGCRPVEIAAAPLAKVLYLKPIHQFLQAWDSLLEWVALREVEKPLRVVFVGGGAAAFEVAIACRHYFGDRAIIHVVAGGRRGGFSSNDKSSTSGFLAQFSWLARLLAKRSLRRLSISLSEGFDVARINQEEVVLENNKTIAADVTFIATGARAPDFFKKSGLPVDAHGFIEITETLLVRGQSHLFAAGDCAHFLPRPLAKSGVYAVREGSVLKQNIAVLLQATPSLKAFIPARHTLALLSSERGEAIAVFGWFAVRSKWAWWLKNKIDLNFMARYG